MVSRPGLGPVNRWALLCVPCASGIGEPVGYISTEWTGDMEGGDDGGTVALNRTESGVSVAKVIRMTGPDDPVDGVIAGGTDREGGPVYVRGVVRDICNGCPINNVACASQPGEPYTLEEPGELASKLYRPSLSLCFFVSMG